MYDTKVKKWLKIISYMIAINLIVVIFVVLFLLSQTNIDGYFNNYQSDIKIIKDQVLITSSDQKTELVNLPVRKDAKLDYSYSFIPKTLQTGDPLYIYVKADYLSFDLISDSQIIYQSGKTDSKYTKTGGHILKLVKIDQKYLDKTMKISFKSNYPSTSGIVIPSIVIGSESDLFSYIIKSDILEILMFSLLFTTGLIVLLIGIILFFLKKPSANLLALGSLSLLMSFYLVIRISFFTMIIDLPNFLYIVDYAIFDIAPTFILFVLLSHFKKVEDLIWQQVVLNTLLVIISLNALIQFILQITGHIEYLDLRRITMYFIMLSFLLFTILPFTLNGKKYKFKKTILLSTLPLTFSMFLTFILYILRSEIKFVITVSLTVCLFLVTQFIAMFREYIKDYAEERTVNLYKKLALIDNLTSLSSRNAFEKDIEKIKLENNKSDKVLFMFIDINNLKYVNDTFSHKAGDILIRAMGEIISSIEIKFKDTRAYRYGGDEFIIISRKANQAKAIAILDNLNDEADEYKLKNRDIPLSFSLGYSIENISDDFDVEQLIVNADKKMYEQKYNEKGL